MSYIAALRPARRISRPYLLGLILLLSAACWFSYQHIQQTTRDRVEMKKSRGRNESHANQKRREKAEEEYQKAKEAYETQYKKRRKDQSDRELLEKLKKKAEHWRKKKDWRGENHSQKHKGR